MRDHLDQQSRIDLIDYKMGKAAQTILEADLLAGSAYYTAAINRLYYAAYYAVSALMLKEGLETVTHKGVKLMLGLKFIQPGTLDREYGKIYQRLFDSRQSGDYEDFVYYDQDVYEELRPLCQKFIEGVREFIER